MLRIASGYDSIKIDKSSTVEHKSGLKFKAKKVIYDREADEWYMEMPDDYDRFDKSYIVN